MECADVGFVLDVSGSIGSEYLLERDFVKQLAKKMGIWANGVHASVVQFSSSAYLKIPFMDDITDFTSEVHTLYEKTEPYGNTRIDKGLDVAFDEMFQTSNGMRPFGECNKVVIVMTDGQNDYPNMLIGKTDRFHEAGIRVVVIGVGSQVDNDELLRLVKFHNNFYQAKDFDELLSDSFLANLAAC